MPSPFLAIDGIPTAPYFIHHVEGHHNGTTKLQKLQRQVQVALQVGGIHDVDDHIGLIFHNIVSGDDLLHGIGAEAVDAGQIHNGHVAVFVGHRFAFVLLFLHMAGQANVGLLAVVVVQHSAGFLLHRYAGPVANVLVGAG